MCSIVYWKATFVWLCIRQHYYRFELPRTLCILGDPTRIPYPSEKNPLAILFGAIHQKQHLSRLLCMFHPGSRVFEWGMVDPSHRVLLLDPTVYRGLHLLDNPSERLAILNPSYHLRLLATFSLRMCVCVCFLSFWPRVENFNRHPGWAIYEASFP